jgi:hypothetical protein
MAYLLDTNTFIEPNNRLCPIDVCPGLWDWFIDKNLINELFSIDKVYEELLKQEDQLSNWAKKHKKNLFLDTTDEVSNKVIELSSKIENNQIMFTKDSSSHKFSSHAKDKFLSGADIHLICHAIVSINSSNHIVVTQENIRNCTNNHISIPYICKLFNIECIDLTTLLRIQKVKFVLNK